MHVCLQSSRCWQVVETAKCLAFALIDGQIPCNVLAACSQRVTSVYYGCCQHEQRFFCGMLYLAGLSQDKCPALTAVVALVVKRPLTDADRTRNPGIIHSVTGGLQS